MQNNFKPSPKPGLKPGFAPKKKDQRDKDGFRMNYEINAKEVRVIDEDGGMIGVMAPREAVRLAEDKGLDLIEIAPTANPPTCKIMDYGKYKYEQKKKAQQSKKNQVIIDIKEVQLRPRTEEHDLETKLRHAKRFLEDGDKVKFNLRFKGREMAHSEQGHELLKKVAETLKGIGVVEVPPKMEGKQLFCLMAPDPVHLKEVQKQKKQQQAQAQAEAKKTEESSKDD